LVVALTSLDARGVRAHPDSATAYVVIFTSRTVTTIATVSNTAGPPIQVGRGPRAIAITP